MRIEIDKFVEQIPELLGKLKFGGEEQVIITQNGAPVAKLMNYHNSPRKYKLGVAKGKFIIPDDWDAKNPEIAEMFGVN